MKLIDRYVYAVTEHLQARYKGRCKFRTSWQHRRYVTREFLEKRCT